MSDATSSQEALPWRAIKEPEWRAVLASNVALARTDNEDALLTEICESAVDAGGYLLAWYGRVVVNGVFRITAIASAGTSSEYLDDLRLTWESHAAGFPQADLANGARDVFVSDDIFADALFADDLFSPWRDKAREFGIRSLVAIPVFVSGEVDGFLTIYSADAHVFDVTAVSILATLCQHIGLGMEKYRAAARINDALEGTIRVLTRALEARDPYTAGHQSGVAALAEQIAIRLGLDDDQVQGIRLAALIHDIGKIGVPTELLVKPGKLRLAEMNLIREHVAIGEEVLSTIDFPWPIAAMVGQHHERCDGSGYPRGLLGPDTLLGSRIIAVADVTEAMSRPRPYRASVGLEATVDFLRSGRGSLFDEDVVDATVILVEDGSFTL
jgi:putative nucleotidyltransferase with HDIG domain